MVINNVDEDGSVLVMGCWTSTQDHSIPIHRKIFKNKSNEVDLARLNTTNFDVKQQRG